MKILGTAFALMLLSTSLAATERGRDGHLNILYWQAPSILNPYLSSGTKDIDASSLVLEPLALFDDTGTLVPRLAQSVPTLSNGGITADLKSITWKLKPGLVWSDGSPVTSADVVFTAEYCRDPSGGCAQLARFDDVASITAPDDQTVKITYSVPKPFPYGPFVGGQSPILQAAQFASCKGAKAPQCTDANFGPIGTGPFRVTEFRSNDVISFAANPNYRDPAKPAFATVTFKGGGNATASARAVLETGEFDYAWNLQLAPDVLANMAKRGRGVVETAFSTAVERLVVNLTDPDARHGDARSTRAHPHPFLTDEAVRKAMSMAIDRILLVEIGYGAAGRATCNVVPAPEIYASKANDGCLVHDMAGARKLLDEAGWLPGSDGIRQKDGVRLSILYQTSTNAVRQDFQALIKQWWNEIGIEVELRNINASVFFGGDPGNPDTFQKFQADIQMYTSSSDSPDPQNYLGNWRCGHEPRPETQWQGTNIVRYCNAEYDRLMDRMASTGDLSERAELARAMNDLLVQNHVLIPLVARGFVSAYSKSLGGVKVNAWDSEISNIADWYRRK